MTGLQTIGTLTSSIAHEFNNLLTPIMGYSILVLEQLPSDAEELYDNVLEIYNSSRKAKEIIARLSDLSRKNTSLTFQYVSPDELVRKVLAVASPARPPHVEVRTDLAWPPPVAPGQRDPALPDAAQPDPQCLPRHGARRRNPHRGHPAGGGVSLLPGLRHRAPAFRRRCSPTSLSPSLPPRSVARAPAWDWPPSGR